MMLRRSGPERVWVEGPQSSARCWWRAPKPPPGVGWRSPPQPLQNPPVCDITSGLSEGRITAGQQREVTSTCEVTKGALGSRSTDPPLGEQHAPDLPPG